MDRRKARKFPAGLAGSLIAADAGDKNPLPHLRFGPRGVGRFIEAPKNAEEFSSFEAYSERRVSVPLNPQPLPGRIYMIQGDSTASEKLLELAESLLQRLIGAYPHLLAGDQMDEESPRRWLLITREAPM